MRKISDQMDLIQGVSFSNKRVHKIKPKKSEELNRQVHELL